MTYAALDSYPELATLYARQIAATPRHQASLSKRIGSSDAAHLAMANRIAGWIVSLTGDRLDQFLGDYDWICNLMLEEELHFRRTGAYRLKTFAEAIAQVYSNDALMGHYMNGLLMTQVWWSNHTEAMRFYVDEFLGGFDQPFRHLEIGPGHGLLLYLAGRAPTCTSLDAWDVSAQSIANTHEAMRKLGGRSDVRLVVQDLFADLPQRGAFDSIVLAEVLEHLEQPREALQRIKALMSPEGRLFINMPINSPAPDHLFLLETPEAVVSFVEAAGFRIERSRFFPLTGMSLEKARRTGSTITVVLVARSA